MCSPTGSTYSTLYPKLHGVVRVRFVTGPSGHVTSTRIAKGSTLKHKGVRACIRAAVLRWRFPKPVGTRVVVTYPFRLETAH